jgi:hypothetical protein
MIYPIVSLNNDILYKFFSIGDAEFAGEEFG